MAKMSSVTRAVAVAVIGLGCSTHTTEQPPEAPSEPPVAPASSAVVEPASDPEPTTTKHPYAALLEPGDPAAQTYPPPVKESFGDPKGWENVRSADPWATDVMATLNSMAWPAWMLEASDDHNYKFKLKVCKDGSIAEVIEDDVVADPERDPAIKAALEALELSRMPEHMTAKMKSDCAVLDYWFHWQRGLVL